MGQGDKKARDNLAPQKALKTAEPQEPFQCSWCPCTFFHASDYDGHMRRFGELEFDHRKFWWLELRGRR